LALLARFLSEFSAFVFTIPTAIAAIAIAPPLIVIAPRALVGARPK